MATAKTKKTNPAASPQPQKPTPPKSRKKLYRWGGGILLVLFISIFFVSPRGSIQYGVCKSFIELSETYPLEVVPLSVDDFVPIGGPVKMYYKRIDPFGVESVNTIECTFKRDAAGNATTEIQKVDINGKPRTYIAEDPEYIKRFNTGVPALIQFNPDLILPNFALDNIKEYRSEDE